MSGDGRNMAYHLGVDLGTTYTAAALARHGRAEPITLGTSSVAVPTVAYLADSGELLFGQAAVRRSATEASRVAREFKRRVGDPTPVILDGTPIQAEMLMARLLAWVIESVTAGEGEPPASLAVTHPANWGRYKLDLLQQAIRQVGLEVDHLVPEPVAAASFYASQRELAPGAVVAVYDLGGGTFDAALVRSEPSGFAIVGQADGIERLGGIDFDHAVLRHVAGAINLDLDALDLEDAAFATALGQLRQACVEAKEALSSETDVAVPVMLPGLHTEVRLTRGEFESMIRPTLDETLVALRRTIASAELTADDVSAVLLVGGSSRIPLIDQLVNTELKRPTAVDARPKDAIPMGAALMAAAVADSTAGPVDPPWMPAPVLPAGPPGPPPGSQPSASGEVPPRPPVPSVPVGAGSGSRGIWWAAAVLLLASAGVLAGFLLVDGGSDDGGDEGLENVDSSEASRSTTSTSPEEPEEEGSESANGSDDEEPVDPDEDPETGLVSEVSNASASRSGDRTFTVTFSYSPAGADVDSCTVSVAGSSTATTCADGAGSAEVSVDDYNTPYTFTVDVGDVSADTTGTSAAKPLTVDGSADRWSGSCYFPDHGTSRPVMAEPGKCADVGPNYYVRMASNGSTERARCWANDVSIQEQGGTSSTVWLQVDDGWMNALYFSEWDSAEANLPPC